MYCQIILFRNFKTPVLTPSEAPPPESFMPFDNQAPYSRLNASLPPQLSRPNCLLMEI
ncbi:hypothetical protein PISMIDRAFT_682265 [Pisolithus microcarpus 441]|uniref:Uncharacterized protein n=1 Tax=Pisolithus microcarpus 441 TaxID=765257 RepID=A0A0C9ZKL7_9AGAM|nr:hypothetical protein PISMIDRAFT_682265 [Pisolithus microcarpus 441]